MDTLAASGTLADALQAAAVRVRWCSLLLDVTPLLLRCAVARSSAAQPMAAAGCLMTNECSHLILGWQDEADHAGTIATSCLKSLDQSLHFPYLNILHDAITHTSQIQSPMTRPDDLTVALL